MTAACSPPELLQLAGHPLRWRLMGALAKGDRTVQELCALTGEPQNLVSYHLGKLREGGILSARRSAADRRDTYYRLDLAQLGALLSDASGALHPGLRLARAPRPPITRNTLKVLFLCTGNSARSQMAEALLEARSNGAVAAWSAGSDPKPLHPNAVRAMREHYGIDISMNASKPLRKFARRRFDHVISLCDLVREVCPPLPGHPDAIHWSIPNPSTGAPDDETYPAFVDTAAEIASRVDFFLAALADGGHAAQG